MGFLDAIFGQSPDKVLATKIMEETRALEQLRDALDPLSRVFVRNIVNRMKDAKSQFTSLNKKQIEETFGVIEKLRHAIGEAARGQVRFDGRSISVEALDTNLKTHLDLLAYYVDSNIVNANVAPISLEKIEEFIKTAKMAGSIENLTKKKAAAEGEVKSLRQQKLDLEKQLEAILALVETGTLSKAEINAKKAEYQDLKKQIESIKETLSVRKNTRALIEAELKKAQRYNDMVRFLAERTALQWESACTDEEFLGVVNEYNEGLAESQTRIDVINQTYQSSVSLADDDEDEVDDAFAEALAKSTVNKKANATRAQDDKAFGFFEDEIDN